MSLGLIPVVMLASLCACGDPDVQYISNDSQQEQSADANMTNDGDHSDPETDLAITAYKETQAGYGITGLAKDPAVYTGRGRQFPSMRTAQNQAAHAMANAIIHDRDGIGSVTWLGQDGAYRSGELTIKKDSYGHIAVLSVRDGYDTDQAGNSGFDGRLVETTRLAREIVAK